MLVSALRTSFSPVSSLSPLSLSSLPPFPTPTTSSSLLFRRFSTSPSWRQSFGVKSTPTSLSVTFEDGKTTSFSNTWIRDNDPGKLHKETFQRTEPFSVTTPSVATISSASFNSNNDELKVVWSDETESTLPSDWLDYQAKRSGQFEYNSRLTLWKNLADLQSQSNSPNLPSVPYSAPPLSDAFITDSLSQLQKFGFVLVSGAPPQGETTKELGEGIGYLQTSVYGSFWDYEVNGNEGPADGITDTAYTGDHIPPHTDGTYMHSSPGIQVFHVISHKGTGGKTMLVDSFFVAEKLRKTNPAVFKYLTEEPLEWYHKEAEYDMREFQPIIKLGYNKEIIQVRFNDLDRAPPPPSASPAAARAYHEAVEAIYSEINDESNQILIQLPPDQILLTDNWRVMHGRTSFTGQRRICGCYIGKDTYQGKLRSRTHKFV